MKGSATLNQRKTATRGLNVLASVGIVGIVILAVVALTIIAGK